MQYKFINNFTVTLGVGLASTDTTMILSEGAANFADASATVDAEVYYPLTLVEVDPETLEELSHEIVYVTGVAGSELTVLRGQEGTTAPATWASGTPVSSRVTAGIMHALTYGTIEAGGGAPTTWPLLMGPVSEEFPEGITTYFDLSSAWSENGEGTIIIGGAMVVNVFGAAANTLMSPTVMGGWVTLHNDNGYNPIVIGNDIETKPGATEFILIGQGSGFGGGTASVGNEGVVAVGAYAFAPANRTANVGTYSSASEDDCVALGYQAGATEGKTTAIGSGSRADEYGASVLGSGAYCGGAGAIHIGPEGDTDGDFAVCIAYGTQVDIKGGYLNGGLSYVPSPDPDANTTLQSAAAQAFGTVTVPSSYLRSAQQVVLRTEPLDLSVGTAEFQHTLPAGVRFFIDEVDVVAKTAVSGTPQVSVGSTSGGVDVVASTALTAAAIGSRDKLTPASDAGVAGSLFANVAVTGTGSVVLVLKGYVLQD